MHRLSALWRRLRTLWRRDEYEHDLDAELQFHLEMLVEQNLRAGMPPARARREARIAFGGVERVKDECRDARGVHLLEETLADARHALRGFRRTPGFAAAAVLTLALGIGATVAVFSAVSALLLRPLPYHAPERIVVLGEAEPGRPADHATTSFANAWEWKRHARTLEAVAIVDDWSPTLTGAGDPERLAAAQVTADAFRVFRVSPALGRAIVARDNLPGSEPVVVLDHAFWQRRFGGDPAVVGRLVTLNGRPWRVVGVLPPEFRGPAELGGSVWGSLVPDPRDGRNARSLRAFARVREGSSVRAARAELERISAVLAERYPENRGMHAVLRPLRDELAGNAGRPLVLLMGMTTVVLLVTCGNVSNLLLARGAGREREIALRAALGATRPRVVRQLMTESLLLGVAGGALGTALGALGLRAIHAAAPAALRERGVQMDVRVLAFAVVLSVLCAVGFGLLPAIRTAQPDLEGALRQGDRGSTGAGSARLRRALAMAQLAGAVALLAAGALLARSFARVLANEPGARTDGVLAFSLVLPEARYPAGQEGAAALEIVRRLRALPGVRSAAATSLVPFSGEWDRVGVEVEGMAAPADGRFAEADRFIVTPDYFATLEIGRVAGRLFGPGDHPRAPHAAVVDARFVERVLGGQPALGRRVRLPGGGEWATIVGVVGHVRHYGRDVESGGQIYFSQVQQPWRWVSVLARTDGDPLRLLDPARRSVWSVDPQLAVYGAGTLADLVAEQGAVRRLTTWLVGVFAVIAAAIAVIGLYGVISFDLARRHREFGIRIALGASPRRIVRLALGAGARLTLWGIAIGVAAAVAGGRLLGALLYGVQANDPLLLAVVSLLLAAVALLASWLPARRAARVDPVLCLRAE